MWLPPWLPHAVCRSGALPRAHGRGYVSPHPTHQQVHITESRAHTLHAHKSAGKGRNNRNIIRYLQVQTSAASPPTGDPLLSSARARPQPLELLERGVF